MAEKGDSVANHYVEISLYPSPFLHCPIGRETDREGEKERKRERERSHF